MKSYCVKLESGEMLVAKAYKAQTIKERLKGLLGRSCLRDDEGLLIEPCSSIHTVCMQFPIDVIFLDKHDKVTAWGENVQPNRMMVAPWGTRKTLELASGVIKNRVVKKETLYFERYWLSSELTG